jgi:hypothetical protein
VFGIPLSLLALSSGLTLAFGGPWGVLRYPWVTIKLALLVSVVLVGALLLGPSVEVVPDGGADRTTVILGGASWDVVALALATGLSVYRPGRARRPRRARREPATPSATAW